MPMTLTRTVTLAAAVAVSAQLVADEFATISSTGTKTIGKLYEEGKAHWLTMRHQGRIYVMLGQKRGD